MKPVHRDSDGLEIDYSERAGFLTGKSEAIARWQAKKDKEAFAAIVNQLRVRKWTKAVRAENGARLAKHRAVQRASYHRHPEWRAKQNVKNRKAPRERTCVQCGAVYALPYPHPRGGMRKVCSDECAKARKNAQARVQQAPKRRAKGIRETGCTRCGERGHNRRTCRRAASEAA